MGLAVMKVTRFYANLNILPKLYMSSVISYIQFGKILFSAEIPPDVPVSILHTMFLPLVLQL